MEYFSLCNCYTTHGASPLFFFNSTDKKICHNFLTPTRYRPFISVSKFKTSLSSSFRVRCNYTSERNDDSDDEHPTTSWAYGVLGVDPPCSSARLKAAFRTKVKQFHPDVMRDGKNSDAMIRRVIQAYEILSNCSKSEIIERECMDPFDQPECEAFDVFVNEVLCFGKGCPYSCVDTAPHVFRFSSETGAAHAASQGHGEDYRVQRAVGMCPRSCIHYVTPSQRIILEELLDSIVDMPYDTSAEAEFLYSLILKAKYENSRYQIPKRKARVSGKDVDWF